MDPHYGSTSLARPSVSWQNRIFCDIGTLKYFKIMKASLSHREVSLSMEVWLANGLFGCGSQVLMPESLSTKTAMCAVDGFPPKWSQSVSFLYFLGFCSWSQFFNFFSVSQWACVYWGPPPVRLGKWNPSLHFNRGMAAKYVEEISWSHLPSGELT